MLISTKQYDGLFYSWQRPLRPHHPGHTGGISPHPRPPAGLISERSFPSGGRAAQPADQPAGPALPAFCLQSWWGDRHETFCFPLKTAQTPKQTSQTNVLSFVLLCEGMLALEMLGRRAHNDHPNNFSRSPPYTEDVKWLLGLAARLGEFNGSLGIFQWLLQQTNQNSLISIILLKL